MRFVVRPPAHEEVEEGEAEAVALGNALGKARAVERADGEVVLGVDTVVSLGGRLYGKPQDEAQARAGLRALSGATHTVLSAIALLGLGELPVSATASTQVRFRELDAATIEWYLGSGEWRERAGGYAIQGAGCALVESIAGDWTNVVGLPVAALVAAHPSLLGARNNRFSPAEGPQLQR